MNYPSLPDSELLSLVVAHDDQAAFREIYVRYWKSVFLVAYKKVHSKEQAEELTQNLFVNLWEKRSGSAIKNLSAYLFGALKYNILDYYKSQMVHEKYMNYIQVSQNEGAHTTEESILLGDLSEAIEKGIALLPQKTQQVFRLSRVENFSVKEISQVLNLSEKAVEYHITQSLKIIRCYLREYLLVFLLFFYRS